MFRGVWNPKTRTERGCQLTTALVQWLADCQIYELQPIPLRSMVLPRPAPARTGSAAARAPGPRGPPTSAPSCAGPRAPRGRTPAAPPASAGPPGPPRPGGRETRCLVRTTKTGRATLRVHLMECVVQYDTLYPTHTHFSFSCLRLERVPHVKTQNPNGLPGPVRVTAGSADASCATRGLRWSRAFMPSTLCVICGPERTFHGHASTTLHSRVHNATRDISR